MVDVAFPDASADRLFFFWFCLVDVDLPAGPRLVGAVGGISAPSTMGVMVKPVLPARTDAKFGAFEMSIAVLNEAASLALSVPYLAAVANIFVQIIRIKGVRRCFFPSFSIVLVSLVFRQLKTFIGSRSVSRDVGRGDVQRRQGRRSRQAILRVVSASRAVRRRDVSAELCLHHTRTRKVKPPAFVLSPLRSVPFNLRFSVFLGTASL